jgi:hypothetical protein
MITGRFNLMVLLSLCLCPTLSYSLASHSAAGVVVNSNCIGDLYNTSNSKSKDFETNARKLAVAQNLTAEDVLARLIFSEGLATGCLRDEECNTVADFKINILTKIGWGIAKRFKSKANQNNPMQLNKDIYDTVFKKLQFRTSFVPTISSNRENIYAQAFLCPEKVKNYLGEVNLNYLELLKAAQEVAVEVSNNPIIGDYRFVTDFYYPKSPVLGELIPTWTKPVKPIISNNWISMYHVSTKKQSEVAPKVQTPEPR